MKGSCQSKTQDLKTSIKNSSKYYIWNNISQIIWRNWIMFCKISVVLR